MQTAIRVITGIAMVALVGCGVQRPFGTGFARNDTSLPTFSGSSAPVIVWNRLSPVSPPTTGVLANPRVTTISTTVSGWVITDQFRFHGISIAGAEGTGNAARAAIIVTHHGMIWVHRLSDGTGAAIITSWNAYNVLGKKIPPSIVYFLTLHGVAGSVQLTRGTVTYDTPQLLLTTATAHLPSDTWSDGQWYDLKTVLCGPRFVSVVTQGKKVIVMVSKMNNFSDPQTTFQISGNPGDLTITGIDSSGTVVNLRGRNMAGSLNLVTGKWRPAANPNYTRRQGNTSDSYKASR